MSDEKSIRLTPPPADYNEFVQPLLHKWRRTSFVPKAVGQIPQGEMVHQPSALFEGSRKNLPSIEQIENELASGDLPEEEKA